MWLMCWMCNVVEVIVVIQMLVLFEVVKALQVLKVLKVVEMLITELCGGDMSDGDVIFMYLCQCSQTSLNDLHNLLYH